MSNNKVAFFLSMIVLAAVSTAVAQMGTGRITGKITDPQGNPIAGAVITVVDATGKKLEGTSEDDGDWAILGFRSGTYDFTIEADGYQTKTEQKQVREMDQNKLNVSLVPLVSAAGGDREASNALLAEANELLKQSKHAEAIAKYEELLVAEPAFYQAHQFIGVAYREMGDLDAALAEFEKVLAEDAMHANTLIRAGDVLVAQGKLDEAVTYFEKAVSQTTDAIVPFNVAEIYFDQQDTAKAIEYYQIASEYDPEWVEPHLKVAYAHLNAGDLASAKASFQKVVEMAPDSPQAQLAQGALSAIP